MKNLALSALAAMACSIITLPAQAAPSRALANSRQRPRRRVWWTMFGGVIVTTIARCSGIVVTAAAPRSKRRPSKPPNSGGLTREGEPSSGRRRLDDQLTGSTQLRQCPID
jgi:hypothetical protein